MKGFFIFSIILFLINKILSEIEEDLILYENEILIMNDETYENLIKENENILVLSYAPWCHYFKQFGSIY